MSYFHMFPIKMIIEQLFLSSFFLTRPLLSTVEKATLVELSLHQLQESTSKAVSVFKGHAVCRSPGPAGCSGKARGGPAAPPLHIYAESEERELPLTQPGSLQHCLGSSGVCLLPRPSSEGNPSPLQTW